ncbi:MAG: hypothetical protein H7Z41_02230, partial [Cytophagales bacterium]|nr:hypothetical protein [Armatimonadota bacterium]
MFKNSRAGGVVGVVLCVVAVFWSPSAKHNPLMPGAQAQSKSPAPAAARWRKMPLLSPEAKKAGISPGGEGGQWPRGGVAVGPADPDFLLLPIDVGGLYRSLDGGRNWEMALVGWNARGANGFAMDPRNPNRVLGIAGNSLNWKAEWGQTPHGVYLSTNKAASWKQTLSSPDGMGGAVAYEPVSFDAARGYCAVAYYASHTQGLFRTSDGGATWQKVSDQPIGMEPEPNAKVTLACHPARRGTVYLGGKTGLFKSEDAGTTFRKVRGGEVRGLAVVPSLPDDVFVSGSEGILRSTDAGQTFAPLAAAGLDRLDGKPVRDLAVSPADPNRIGCWVSGDKWKWTRYVSHDGGSTFQTVTTNSQNAILPQNSRQGYITWHPSEPKVSWNLGGDWVTKSTDGGRTFLWSANGYNGVMLGGMFSFSAHAPGVVFLAFQDYNGA